MNIYDDVRLITEIPELAGWYLTKGLGIELESDCYRVWDLENPELEMRLVRGTGSSGWGWGALLAPRKKGLVGGVIGALYPFVGMAYGLKDKLFDYRQEKAE